MQPPCVATCFDGTGWDCFAVRAMPDRHWVVLRTRVADPHAELVVGLGTYGEARRRAAELARTGFAHAAGGDVRPPDRPRLAELTHPGRPAMDTRGDPAALGSVIAVTRLR